MADVRDILINLLGRETVSGAAKRAADGVGKLGDGMQATARDADRLDREIEQTEVALKGLAAQFARTDDVAQRIDLTKTMRKQQTELRRLVRNRDIINDAVRQGEEAGRGFAVSMVARIGPILAHAPLGPAGAAIGGVLAASVVPALGAAVGGAVLGGTAGVGVLGGLVLASKDSRVQAAGKALGRSVLGSLEAGQFVEPAVRGIEIISDAWTSITGDVDGAFRAASRHVEPLARGVAGLARELGPALRDGIEAAGPAIREISDGLPRLGRALGDLFGTFADNADEGASALRFLFQMMETGVYTVGGLVDALGWVYRRTLDIGAAGAAMADTLWGWLPGAGPKITEGRKRITELKDALEDTGEAGQAGGEQVAGGLRKVEDAAGDATAEVKSFAQALDESLGRVYASEEANIRMASALRRLTEAAKDGKGAGIDPHTEAGERNRRALLDAARAANDNAAAIRETTGDHQRAAAIVEQARADFLRAADAMGVESREAHALATQLFRIPNVDRTVSVDASGARTAVAAYKRWLASVNLDKTSTVRQRIIAERHTTRGGVREFSAGGYVRGAGAKGVDSVPAVLAPGEGVLTSQEVDKVGGAAGLERLRAAIRGDTGSRSAPSAPPATVGSSPASGGLTIRVEAGAGAPMERAFADMFLGLIRTGALRLAVDQGRIRPA